MTLTRTQAGILFGLIGVIAIGLVVGILTRPSGSASMPAPTVVPTATPIPTCSLTEILAQQGFGNISLDMDDGATMPFIIGDKVVTIRCAEGKARLVSISAAPQGSASCSIDSQISVADGQDWVLNGVPVKCSNGQFVSKINAPAAPTATTSPTLLGCTDGGFSFNDGAKWKINGQDVICNNGGWTPLSIAPAPIAPTAVAPNLKRCYPFGQNQPFLTDGQMIVFQGQILKCDGATGQMGYVGPAPTATP